MSNVNYVIGVDFGTDSVRVLIADTSTGSEVSSDVQYYERWSKGAFCNASINQFRQHPLDYIESLEKSINNAIIKGPSGTAENIRGISIDTTGSTPCATDKNGKPLALTEGFEDNPNAMFILWKDHTAISEAEEINSLAKSGEFEDFTKYSGGVYSSEWFWSKILHTLRIDEEVRRKSYSWIEHCDWIPALLSGNTDLLKIKRSRTAAGHKAMWYESWYGLPSEEFLVKLDPLLEGLRNRLYKDTYTNDIAVGTLSEEWAKRLGLKTNVHIGVGSFDAHTGGVGAEIIENTLVKVMGTSTCDIIISDLEENNDCLVSGICGQVNGSIIPGMLGLEAGQSAVGDIYAWFRDLILWPIDKILNNIYSNREDLQKSKEKIVGEIISDLSEAAKQLPLSENDIVALDWMNGRRTPYANQALKKGVISGINLGSDAPRIFKSLVEATAFGAKKIVDRFTNEGVNIDAIIAVGGIPKKSPFVMQVHADVLNMHIKVAKSEQVCALGTAMAAATVSGIFQNIADAQKSMGSGFEATYKPIPENVEIYNKLYNKYSVLGEFIENKFTL